MQGSTHSALRVFSGNSDNIGFFQAVQTADLRIGTSTNSPVHLFVNGVDRVHLDTSGNLNIPNDSGKLQLGASQDLQIYHDGSHSLIKDTGTGSLILDGNDIIRLRLNGTTKFQTDSSGVIASGTEHKFTSGTSGDCELIIESDTDNSNEGDNPRILFRQDGGIDVSAIQNGDNKLEIINSVSNGGITFKLGTTNGYTNATEKMSLSSSGCLSIGTTDNSVAFNDVQGISLDGANGYLASNRNNNESFGFGRGNAGRVGRFFNAGTAVGRIVITSNSTSYETTGSDRSLKKNFEPWNENTLSLFKNINPQKFNFIQEEDGATKSKGFIAQELANSFPEAYSKGGEEDDKYWFNPSGMVVYLMKALQEAVARIEALEAK